MIDYPTYCQIKDGHDTQHLTVAQIAAELHLHHQTVAKWLAVEKYRQRQTLPRPSRL